jgi:hypothetical protein
MRLNVISVFPGISWLIFATMGLLLKAGVAFAQCSQRDTVQRTPSIIAISSARADSARLGSLLGSCWGDGSLIAGSIKAPASRLLTLRALDPVITNSWNSKIPESGNDGALWAGRGLNTSATAGGELLYRSVRIVAAPQFVRSENLPFTILPSGNPAKSAFASPWHSGGNSADLPLRFGDALYTRIEPGETTIEVSTKRVGVGASSASQWWGPGIRNALVLSSNAAGIPRIYVKTSNPLRTRIGDFEGIWFLGALTESPFFDGDPRNDTRSISAGTLTLRLAADTGLTVGVAREVIATTPRFGSMPGHVADLFLDWGRSPATGSTTRTSDQVISFFARWVFPESGVGLYAEWAKRQLPVSTRELLVDPQKGQGYTLGIEWANEVNTETTVRFNSELTMLEQTPENRNVDVPEFYVSHTVPQGFTQQGQSIGASIGPGSSSQFVSGAVLHRNWQLSANLGRIRSEETAYYRTVAGNIGNRDHDMSLYAGLTGRYDSRLLAVDGGFTRTWRMNYLFQTVNPYVRGNEFDVHNMTLIVTLTPHVLAR